VWALDGGKTPQTFRALARQRSFHAGPVKQGEARGGEKEGLRSSKKGGFGDRLGLVPWRRRVPWGKGVGPLLLRHCGYTTNMLAFFPLLPLGVPGPRQPRPTPFPTFSLIHEGRVPGLAWRKSFTGSQPWSFSPRPAGPGKRPLLSPPPSRRPLLPHLPPPRAPPILSARLGRSR
jgi:hypothetical protein